MDNPRHYRSLVVLSMFRAGILSWHRWTEALVAALAATTADPIGFGPWRIVVGITATSRAPSARQVEEAAATAQAAGGDLSIVAVSGEGDSVRAMAGIAGHDAALTLLVDSDVLVLPSTVRRLLRAHLTTGTPVAARVLPLPDADARAACVLASFAHVATAREAAVIQPEAVVFRERGIPSPRTSVGRDRSLMEDAVLIGDGSEPVAALIADTITVEGPPLLSVVMRTQLRRPEALRDALLCLAAQTDGRFELLLVAHDVDSAGVESVLRDQPHWLRERTRVLTARGGTRSRPLNVGFSAARGSHVAVLDDDDVVTAHWVQGFLDAAASHPRQLLRAVVGVQRVSAEDWPDGVSGHVADPEVSVPYPPAFDLADHVRVNMTPFMAIAFPRGVLEVLGGADESLEVCEDWDLVLRAASLFGVADLPGLAAVYRRWTSGDDSYSVHDEGVWHRDMLAVRAKLDARPLILPPGSASELAAMSQLRADPSELAEVYGSTSWRVTAPLRAVSRAITRIRGR